jgi:hypothetical protein
MGDDPFVNPLQNGSPLKGVKIQRKEEITKYNIRPIHDSGSVK